jgi:hypothetical protein
MPCWFPDKLSAPMKTSKSMFATGAVILVLAALALTPSLGSPVLTYDAALDFSPTRNPNGVWSYGYSLTLGGRMVLFTQNRLGEGISGTLHSWYHNIADGTRPALLPPPPGPVVREAQIHE